MHERQRPRWVDYAVAVLAPAVALLVRWPLWPLLGDTVPHMTFFPAVMIATYFGGFWPGLVATFLSALAATCFFTAPLHSREITSVPGVVGLTLFVLVCTIISALSESLHRARRRIVADERRRAEEAVHETEERFRQLAKNIREIFWMTDACGKQVIYVSPGYEKLWGRTCRSLYEEPHSWIESVHADDRDRAMEHLEQRGRGVFTDVEFRVVRPDGSVRWVRSRAFPLKDPGGCLSRIVGLTEDITERKRAEERLRQANARLDLAVRGSNIAIWETTIPDSGLDDGHMEILNYWEQLGYDRSESSTDFATIVELIHPEDRERMRRTAQAYLSGATGDYEAEYRVRHRDGSYRWVLARGKAVRDASGKPILFAGSRTDITEQKQAEEKLLLAVKAAESANRAKDEFLANVSHEIRTPMNAILGMTELVLDTPLTEEQRQCLKTVKSAADNLLGVINDLLDFAKIEAGKLELDPADFSLRAALGDTLHALAMRAHKKGLELVIHVQPDVPDALIGDAGRLRQVLINLVGNAIKFTEQGEVVVSVRMQNEKTEGDSFIPHPAFCILHFEVRDTGIGIPPGKQETIFRAFEQEDTSTTRKYGGTGLGLSIAARLVALMGGTIRVESEPDRGSTFIFTARFGRPSHPPESVAVRPPVQLQHLRVLVVDDNATNRHILEEWLRSWRMEPAALGDGLATLGTLWAAVSAGRPYGLVLLDARMPDTDGLALAATIRERSALSATPIILLTSGDRPGDLARSRQLRIDAHLLKPVQQEELLETIYQVMSRTEEDKVTKGQEDQVTGGNSMVPVTPPHRYSATPSPSKPLHILVAEDNEFNVRLLEQLLIQRGHHVRLANNGREALDLLGEGGFDLLLLDVHMPEMDGFQVVRALRERERTVGGHLPVIALTARSRKEDRERCLAAGMDDFLPKPFPATELWAAIDHVVAVRSPDDCSAPSLLDPQVLLAACGGDAAILGTICSAFRACLPEHLAAVQDALRDRDAPRLRKAAHKMCGVVGAFSTATAALASDLEDLAASGRLDEALPVAEQLEGMARELLRQVDGLSIETLRRQAGVTGDPNPLPHEVT